MGMRKLYAKLINTNFGQYLIKTKTFRISLVPASLVFAGSALIGLGCLIALPFLWGERLDLLGVAAMFMLFIPIVIVFFLVFMAGLVWALNPSWKDTEF